MKLHHQLAFKLFLPLFHFFTTAVNRWLDVAIFVSSKVPSFMGGFLKVFKSHRRLSVSVFSAKHTIFLKKFIEVIFLLGFLQKQGSKYVKLSAPTCMYTCTNVQRVLIFYDLRRLHQFPEIITLITCLYHRERI